MYQSILNFKDTQIAIKQVKDFFQKELAAAVLRRVVGHGVVVGFGSNVHLGAPLQGV